MNKISLCLILFFQFIASAQTNKLNSTDEQKITELMSKMTIDEKVGQLIQIVGTERVDESLIRKGMVGSFLLGVNAVERANALQKITVKESRLGIPLIFANDVIHGYHTIFPVPLAEASSWNPELVKKASAIAAFEAASEGTKWTYAPMVDIARDPRWGRIVEGSGEDPFLGSIMAQARVKGFQGDDLKDKTKVAACAKHYVAYGGAEGGRDYNTVDISERTLREVYLPPFHAAIDSGAAAIMAAFNDLNGIPASANYFTLTKILRNEWSWGGVVISDYNSIGELIKHRFAKDKKEAAQKALTAGVDIDMVGDSIDGNVYLPNLKNLVDEGLIFQKQIDESVRRVLRLKYKSGLFEKPYTDVEFYERNNPGKQYKDSIALQLAKESIVLLKNENNLLPLNKNIRSIALLGPLADSKTDMMGPWSGAGRPEDASTVMMGLKKILPGNTEIKFVKGCNVNDNDTSDFADAVKAARSSDIAIMVLGEDREMSGEAASRAHLNIPGMQEELAKRIYKTGKPIVIILMNGRPLAIDWIKENIPAVIEAWYLGNQAGNAIAEVLFGQYNPSGKLPVTFPRSSGQIPIYYYQKSTGRPIKEEDKYTSKYLDSPNTPLYPFGFGLSYTNFSYKNIKTDKIRIPKDGAITVSVDVVNTGKVYGEEVVQLYIQDEYASVTLPVKQLKGFQKVRLKPGETKSVSFNITPGMLSFLDENLKPVVEPGSFLVMIGGNSVELITARFEVTD